MSGSSRRVKARIIQRRKAPAKSFGPTAQDNPVSIPDVDSELSGRLIVRGGVALKAPEPMVVKMSIEKEFQLVPPDALRMECYPCPICPNRTFLTSEGLERHGHDLHSQRLNEVLVVLERIKRIWAFFQHEGRSPPGVKCPAPAADGPKPLEPCPPDAGPDETPKAEPPELCARCGELVESARLQQHRDLHKANDNLRAELVKQLGKNCQKTRECDICDLIFTSRTLLISHLKLAHTGPDASLADSLTKRRFHSVMSMKHPFLFGSTVFFRDGRALNRHECAECGFVTEGVASVCRHLSRVHAVQRTDLFHGLINAGEREVQATVTAEAVQVRCCQQDFDMQTFGQHVYSGHKP